MRPKAVFEPRDRVGYAPDSSERARGVTAAMVVRAAVGALLAAACAALIVTLLSLAALLLPPTYEPSARVSVDLENRGDGRMYLAGGKKLQTEELQMLTEATMRAAGSRPVAERVIKRLGLKMTPDELLADLTVERDKTNVVVLTYEGADRKEATRIVNAVGELTSGLASKRSAAGRSVTATVHEASVPEMTPDPKPLKNGLLALVWAWALFAGIPLALVAVLRR